MARIIAVLPTIWLSSAAWRKRRRKKEHKVGLSRRDNKLRSGLLQQPKSSQAESLKAMQEISTAATEASAAAQESQSVAQQLLKAAEINSAAATQSLRKVNNIQELVRSTSGDLEKLIETVSVASESNVESAKMISDLEKQANEIGNVVKTDCRPNESPRSQCGYRSSTCWRAWSWIRRCR
jgi:methyl-accepting chemotaxis protein